MPTDLSTDATDRVEVRDTAGTGLPFSRGIMATSLLATGIDTATAYAIAARIQRDLLADGTRTLDSDVLARRAEDALTQAVGTRAAERYRAWRRVRRDARPIVVALGGAPGVGKSTLATRLALRLGINRVVPTDAIREVLRTVIPETVLPELHVSTYESVPQVLLDGPAPSSFERQASAVSAAAGAVAARLITEGRHVILEGAHIIPGAVTRALGDRRGNAIVIELLLTLPDADLHHKHLQRRQRSEAARDGERHLEGFARIRQIQERLRRHAAAAGVPEWDVSHPECLTQDIVDRIIAAEASDGAPTLLAS